MSNTLKVDKKFIRKWITALRSRKYKRTEGQLRDNNKFCCLGVACNVKNPELWDENIWISDDCGLPTWFLNEIGLSGLDQDKLINMNDDQHKKFYQIANWLEKKFLAPRKKVAK